MSYKPFVIESDLPISEQKYQWRELVSIPEFAKKIKTQSIGEKADINALSAAVSGMPTIFARVNMFQLAMKTAANSTQEQNGLQKS